MKTKEVPIVKPIDEVPPEEDMKKLSNKTILGVYIVLILLGIGTGFLLTRTGSTQTGTTGTTMFKTNKVAGSTDTTTFKDSAEGVIQKDGADGEGTHQLIRDGGPSQTVTLISSVVDLDQYVGKKVKVSGQTLAAKKAAWLMDVGRVELQ